MYCRRTTTMYEDDNDDDLEFQEEEEQGSVHLSEGLDLNELQTNREAMFEIDDNQSYVGADPPVQCAPGDGYRYFQKDILTEFDDDDENEENSFSQFEKIVKKMTDLTVDTKIKKQIINEGIGEVVPAGSHVTVHYNAYLELSDEPYDSTRLRGMPLSFDLGPDKNGEYCVIPGLNIAVASMRKKELSRFYIDYDYIMGLTGCPPRCPGGVPNVFVIELLNFSEGGASVYFSLPASERNDAPFEVAMAAVQAKKKDGQEAVKRNNYTQANKHFRQGLRILENFHLKDEDEERQQKPVLLNFYHNLCVVSLRLPDATDSVIKFANLALDIDPTSHKAMFTKAKALRMKGQFTRAKKELEEVEKLVPGRREVAEEMRKLEAKSAMFDLMQKPMYERMFQQNHDLKHYNIAADALKCSENSKKLLKEKLEMFQDDEEVTEVTFSALNFGPNEMSWLQQSAESMGFIVRQHKRFQDSHMSLCVSKVQQEATAVKIT